MYSVKPNIQQLLSLMDQHQIHHIVISPGSRNMPLAQSFASHTSFLCYPVTDERSAGFFALGLAARLECPVAVCCTSGSALLNLASAVSEAFYQQVPLLVISADRPSAWIGQMDGQTLNQLGVFGDCIRKEVNLPEPQDAESMWFCNRLINEALLELQHKVNGPVHINVPVSEPFFDCSATELPVARMIKRNASFSLRWKNAKRPVIIVGQLPYGEAQNLAPLLRNLNCAVLAEHLSNLPPFENLYGDFDAVLYANQKPELSPDLVIYLGGHVVSKRLKQWLRKIKPTECWRVSPNGDVVDLFQCLTDVFETTPFEFLQKLTVSDSDEYLNQWKQVRTCLDEKKKEIRFDVFSSLLVVKSFLSMLPNDCSLHLANSSSVRLAQNFPLSENVHVYCNRGVNGIDGSLSAAMGQAAANQNLTYLLIGDLSFFYDMNGLWNHALSSNLRVVLLNNGGGEIFHNLPGLDIDQHVNKFVCADHTMQARGWAETVGCQYLSATNVAELKVGLETLKQQSAQPILLEVFTDINGDAIEYKRYYHCLK